MGNKSSTADDDDDDDDDDDNYDMIVMINTMPINVATL
jgi:hypothetical protein